MSSSKEENNVCFAYQELERGIFVFSKYLGLFPINYNSGKPSIVLKHAIASGALRLAAIGYVIVAETLRTFSISGGTLSLSYRYFTFYGAMVVAILIKPVTLLRIGYNFKKFFRAVETIAKVDEIIAIPMKKERWENSLVLIMLVEIVSFIYEGVFYLDMLRESPSSILFYFLTLDIYAVGSQFTTLVCLAKTRFEFLSATVNELVAERWCQCHELLCSFNEDVNYCYTIQLGLVMLCSMLYFISRIYVVIKINDLLMGIDLTYWIFISAICIWNFCYTCRKASLMAKKFDDKLYKLIIKDKSRRLLKNKKIMLHFRVQTVEDFTALGCFRFDFPLLCTIISAAVSSVLIMIQFA
ncbi:Gustatory receptor 150c [Halyomorpha halys]|nr:Gustatory receptor 150c [Halyomorpha halys]